MKGDDNRMVVERMWDAFARKDLDACVQGMAHDSFVEDWPQSGEKIVGRENWLGMVSNFPGGVPDVKPVRLYGAGDLWIQELEFDYRGDVGIYFVCAIFEFRDGKIARITEYFGTPFQPADWRAPWVERTRA